MTRDEFLDKMENEGTHYAFTGYGLSENDLDPDVDQVFAEAVREARRAHEQAEILTERLWSL